MKSVMQPCKGPHSLQNFWATHCWKTPLCVRGNITKCSTISFVNLFSPFFSSQRHTAEILLLSNTTPCTPFHASAAAWQVECAQAAKGPAAHHMDQMKSDSQRQRRYGLLMEDWLVTVCASVCGGSLQPEQEIHTCVLGCTCVFKRQSHIMQLCLTLEFKKKKKKRNMTGN